MLKFDAHCHLKAKDYAQGIICTSTIAEWQELPQIKPPSIASAGFLPDRSGCFPDISLFGKALEDHPMWQIGEVGLDARFPNLEGQAAFFRQVLETAHAYDRLVSIHMVREDSLALSLLDGSARTLWHGFTGSVETARSAFRKGCIVSLGPRTVQSRLWSRLDELDVPFLLETDSQDERQPETIERMYRLCSLRLHITMEQLQERIDEGRTICADHSSARA